jgi:hypothetical protein
MATAREIVEIVLLNCPNPDNITVDDVNLSGIDDPLSNEVHHHTLSNDAYHQLLKERIQDALNGGASASECPVCGLKMEQLPPWCRFINVATGAMMCRHAFGVPADNVPDWREEKG